MKKRYTISAKKSFKELFTNHYSLLTKKRGFTLAEVLITLAVIGMVAAMTLPTLIKNINSQKRTAKIQNIEAKLRQGTDLMKVQGRINGFDDTMEFVTELSKYIKITTICDKSNMADCWPGINVTGITVNGEEDKVEVKNIKDAAWFQLDKDTWSIPVGLVTGDGTPMIITYKKDCFVDENDRNSDGTKCIAGIYDINGGNLPNRYGDTDKNKATSDIIPINEIGGVGRKKSCVLILNGTCFISKAFKPDATQGGCQVLQNAGVNVNNVCPYNVDRWANAYNRCLELGGKLPNKSDLSNLALYLYDNKKLNLDKAHDVGFAVTGKFYAWSDAPDLGVIEKAHTGCFYDTYEMYGQHTRGNSGDWGICVWE